MLIDTLNITEEYFGNFKLLSFLEKIKIIYNPWQYTRFGGDDSWGVLLEFEQSFNADIYFWNENLIDHKLLYTEIGPTSNSSFKEFKLTKRLIKNRMSDPIYITESVELDIRKRILKKYNSKDHLYTLNKYENSRMWGDGVTPLITKLYSNGLPEIISIDISKSCFEVNYKFTSTWYTYYDLHEFYCIISHWDNIFLRKTKYRIILGYQSIFIPLEELKEYLFENKNSVLKKME